MTTRIDIDAAGEIGLQDSVVSSRVKLTELRTHASRHVSGGADTIKLDDLTAPDDNTDLDVSTTKHGLVPKCANIGGVLKDTGAWGYCLGTALNLIIKANATNPTYQIDIDAEAIVLYHRTTKLGKIYTAVDITVDITATGANGRNADTAEAASKWYEIKLIGKTDGTIAGFLRNQSDAAPTYPDGYDYSIHLGWVRNNSGSNFVLGFWEGDRFYYDVPINEISMPGTTSSPIAYTDYSLAVSLPPTCKEFDFYLENEPNTRGMYIRPNGQTGIVQISFCKTGLYKSMTDASQIIEAYSTDISHSPKLYVIGYTDRFYLEDD